MRLPLHVDKEKASQFRLFSENQSVAWSPSDVHVCYFFSKLVLKVKIHSNVAENSVLLYGDKSYM